MRSPCYKCLIKPSCRTKRFRELLGDCVTSFNYLWPIGFNKGNRITELVSIESDLKPITWYSLLDKESGNISVIETQPTVIYPFHQGDCNDDPTKSLYKK